MNLLRVKAIAKKEFIQVYRDLRSLGMAIAIPVLLIILFGYALTLDVDHVPLAVWDQDKTQISRDFIRDFSSSPYFKEAGRFNSYHELQDYIDRNKALMAIVVPKDFSSRIQSGRKVPVQLLVDGSDSNTATIAIGYANGVVSGYNNKFIKGAPGRIAANGTGVIEMRPRVWFNPELKSRNFIIPGLVAVIMMIIAALLTSLTVAREWERGTMEQLISTPVKSVELVLGKFIPYFCIGLFDMLIAVVMGQFLFHVPLRGSVSLLFCLSAVFLTGALSLGMLISIATKSQLLASQLAVIATFLPAFLLSGFMYSISNMPKAIQLVSHLIPARYFVTILKGIYLKGVGLRILAMEVLYLALFSFVAFALAVRKFKKKVT
ncbi:MAG: ABC transporter permease [Candidatus Omnitrophica bacterium]|nr:ABC transporter permease [Candidatus Omnitrophota bacterium]